VGPCEPEAFELSGRRDDNSAGVSLYHASVDASGPGARVLTEGLLKDDPDMIAARIEPWRWKKVEYWPRWSISRPNSNNVLQNSSNDKSRSCVCDSLK
jgi:hypothetical protein